MNSDTHYIIHEEKVRHGFITKVICTEKKIPGKKKKNFRSGHCVLVSLMSLTFPSQWANKLTASFFSGRHTTRVVIVAQGSIPEEQCDTE